MSALLQEIKTRQAEFVRLFNAGNAAAVADLYTTDCHFLPPGADVIKGRAGIETFFKADMANGPISLVINTEEVNGSGEWAWERGSYKLGTDTGAYLLTWKKVNNQWMIQNDCFTLDKPAGKA